MTKDTAIHIALVEDDPDIATPLEETLIGEGYRVHRCPTAAALRSTLEREQVDMILLDLALPDGNGLQIAAQIRATTAVPIIMLTGRGSEIDRIMGLELGADDYIVKPFSLREVAARIKAVLRRGRLVVPVQLPSVRKGYRFAGWTLDIELRRLYDPDGKYVSLTVNEFDLLVSIVSASGRILTRNQLLEATRHDNNDDVFDRTVDVLILRLRRKIEPNPQLPQFIMTERGVGYRFNPPVEPIGFD